jgi:hypothetical protein
MSFIHDYSIGYCYNMTLELKEDPSEKRFAAHLAETTATASAGAQGVTPV